MKPSNEAVNKLREKLDGIAQLSFKEASDALEAALSMDAEPVINAQFETEFDNIKGSTTAPIKRVEMEDDGSFTVVIDYWPAQSLAMSREKMAERLFSTDWPNDKWDRFKDGDHAKERYLRMADTALSAQVQDAAEYDTAYKEARQLAVSLHAQHYSDVKQWKPLDDLRGVISQIDNMVCGLVVKPEGWQLAPKEPTQESKDRTQHQPVL